MKNTRHGILPYCHPLYLSESEKTVLYDICNGHTNKEIADKLNISKRTVDKRRENLLMKFISKNTAQMISNAYRLGYLKSSDKELVV